MIIDKNTNYKIGDYFINKYDNVSTYKFTHCVPSVDINVNLVDSDGQLNVYYIFDAPGGDAFAHWVYESFITYPIFLELKKIYPNIKIITSNKKKYVKLFFRLFDDDTEIVYDINNNNICFFPPILSLNDNLIDVNLFNDLIDKYIRKINSLIVTECSNNIILLPRNKKDNYLLNDREADLYNMNDYIIDNNGTILNTYEINNLNIQFNIVNSFKNIILDYGSSFFVNAMFLNGRNVLVIDSFNHSPQIDAFVSMKLLYNKIRDRNNVSLLKNPTFEDVIKKII